MTEIMGRGEAVEMFVSDQLPSQQSSYTPRDGSTESMDPEQNEASSGRRTMKDIQLWSDVNVTLANPN